MSVSKGASRFASVPSADIQRSSFNRSHSLKSTFATGYLNPIFVDEVLPGDTFNLRMSNFTRMATPVFPIMDDMFLTTHFFFVPTRLVWDNFQKFNGEQTDPGDSTEFEIPQVNPPAGGDGWPQGSMADLFGIPIEVDGAVNALHFRSMNLIWNEWFRDQNLQDSLTVPTGDGPDAGELYNLQRRGKRHDYMTSCLPWPQKGPGVSLPLGTTAPVVSTGVEVTFDLGLDQGVKLEGTQSSTDTSWGVSLGGNSEAIFRESGLETDLTNATAATINQLREAFQIQKLYERDARGGTRYTEIIRSHFGVTSPDQRLQRPEYLGGGTQQVEFNPVSQSRGDGTSPQGTQAAYITSSGSNHSFTKSFVEHGVIIGLCSIRANLTYQSGLDRMWSRRTRWDYYWPALAHIGEQAVLNQEIHWQNTSQDDEAFGYQERFSEYRFKPGRICGAFRSVSAQSIDQWHLAQDFAALPTLNATFIEDTPPMQRILATPDEEEVLFDAWFDLTCARPMPTYGVPGLIDHF